MDVEIIKDSVPKIREIYVELKPLVWSGYDGKPREFTVAVWCNIKGEITAIVSLHRTIKFSIPANSCEKEFGKEQWKELKKLCKFYVKLFVENHPDYYYVMRP